MRALDSLLMAISLPLRWPARLAARLLQVFAGLLGLGAVIAQPMIGTVAAVATLAAAGFAMMGLKELRRRLA